MLHSRGAWLCQRCRCYCQLSSWNVKRPSFTSEDKMKITPFEQLLSCDCPGGAMLEKNNNLLEVCFVKSTVATLCPRFVCFSTAKLISYSKNTKFSPKYFWTPFNGDAFCPLYGRSTEKLRKSDKVRKRKRAPHGCSFMGLIVLLSLRNFRRFSLQ